MAPVLYRRLQIKGFYFKQEGKYALGCDLIAPNGYGEIIGGGQREDDEIVLENNCKFYCSIENFKKI